MSEPRPIETELDLMRGYLKADPDNASLRLDTAEIAARAGRPDVVEEVLADDASARATSIRGLAAMVDKDFESAADIFRSLDAREPASPSLRFNLAWSEAMLGNKTAALEALDTATVEALPQAAALAVQITHEAGDFEGAFELAMQCLERFPEDPGLNAAMAELAMDLEREDIARRCAGKSLAHPIGRTAMGMFALQDNDVDRAADLFDSALAESPNHARSWIGRGLVSLKRSQPQQAAEDLDKGASIFGDHLGSWVASGWAHAIAGDTDAAHARFTKVVELDPTFGEGQGSLAALDAMAGRHDAAMERAKVARRLDGESLTATLATILVNQSKGNTERAQALFDAAIRQPVDDKGTTLMDLLVSMNVG